VIALVLLVAGCAADGAGDDEATPETPAQPTAEQMYPDIVDVTVEPNGDTYTFRVTVSSPYDTPERYTDGRRVIGPDGTDEVIVEGRDSEYGYGGGTVTVPLPD
jgi:hypothetical protein